MGTSYLAGVLLGALLAAPPQGAPEDRLYGRVEMNTGEVHTGFIRWGRAGATWTDLLGGYKELPQENMRQAARLRAEAEPEADLAARSIVYNGVRITWDEDDREFVADPAQSGVRFGHVRRVEPVGERAARILLKSGAQVELRVEDRNDRFTDSIFVDVAGGAEVPLLWADLRSIEFLSAPAGASPRATRLHGTVEVRDGGTFTGYLTFDGGRIYTSHVLTVRGGDVERRVAFEEIRALAWDAGASRVLATLADGSTLALTSGQRSVRVEELRLGGVQLPLSRVSKLTFHPPAMPVGYDAFDGARRLRGTVTTRDGKSFTGFLRWDNDESYSWEVLNGSERGVTYTVELAAVKTITTETTLRARVTLVDGRELELSGSNDVGPDNKGIVIELDDGTFRYVDWLQLARAELEHP